ncbi:MAG: glutaminyl-peptide cyclotransferase [Flavobacteriaceae bacterium]
MKFGISTLLFITIYACNPSADNGLRLKLNPKKNKFSWGDSISFVVDNKKNKSLEDLRYYLDDQPIDARHLFSNERLGNHQLRVEGQVDGKPFQLKKTISLLADEAPKLYTYKILNTFPHDKAAYTQGLEFFGESLYESTGLKGQSSLRKVKYTSGEVEVLKPLANEYFGEGITLLNNQIYQLTWLSNIGFIYDLERMEMSGKFNYGASKQGWGLCNDGAKIYKSDGTNRIYILDSSDLSEVDYIEVMTHKNALAKINELEWHDGKIYANTYQFQKEVAVIIDPTSGKVEGVIDFSGLKEQVEQHEKLDVLNGIAYHAGRKSFFVTGKNWSLMFEVEIFEK